MKSVRWRRYVTGLDLTPVFLVCYMMLQYGRSAFIVPTYYDVFFLFLSCGFYFGFFLSRVFRHTLLLNTSWVIGIRLALRQMAIVQNLIIYDCMKLRTAGWRC